MVGFIINAALSCLNWAFYFNSPNAWSLAAGIFCGLMAFACLAMDLAWR